MVKNQSMISKDKVMFIDINLTFYNIYTVFLINQLIIINFYYQNYFG